MEDDAEKPELKPASENIWYVLATIAGEPTKFNDPITEENRRYWNGLMRPRLSDGEYAALKDKDGLAASLQELSPTEHKRIRAALDARGFKNIKIPENNGAIDFNSVELPKYTTFNNLVFAGIADFREATFTGYADFSKATFTGDAYFREATFTGSADFREATFTGNADFREAIFTEYADFSKATFTGYADFSKAIFTGYAYFREATFTGYADFSEATFTGYAYFREATFTGSADFREATFTGSADFKTVVFTTTTDFKDATFLFAPPEFFDAKVSEDIIWPDVAFFPKPPHDKSKAENHKRAYERLSLMMSKLEKTHDKHMFFRLEMRARRALETGWRKFPAKAMNWFYDISCDYGYGFGRALGFWLGHMLLGAAVLVIPAPHNWAGVGNAFATSFANAHSFLGLNRGPLKTVYAQYAKWDWFNVVWTVQGLLGIMFLFFLLLTIRNRFKMG